MNVRPHAGWSCKFDVTVGFHSAPANAYISKWMVFLSYESRIHIRGIPQWYHNQGVLASDWHRTSLPCVVQNIFLIWHPRTSCVVPIVELLFGQSTKHGLNRVAFQRLKTPFSGAVVALSDGSPPKNSAQCCVPASETGPTIHHHHLARLLNRYQESNLLRIAFRVSSSRFWCSHFYVTPFLPNSELRFGWLYCRFIEWMWFWLS